MFLWWQVMREVEGAELLLEDELDWEHLHHSSGRPLGYHCVLCCDAFNSCTMYKCNNITAI